jgi:hypothetical protein
VVEARRAGKTRSDIALLRSHLEDELASREVLVRQTPPHVRDYQIDELALEAAIGAEIRYMNPRARDFDVKSIRSVYTLREGRAGRRLEDCVAVLVSSNAALAHAAFAFRAENDSDAEVSTVITDYGLGNLAWLKAPLAAPRLPELEVMATCYAAMSPSDALWSRYLREIEKLEKDRRISATDLQFLRSSLRAREELMDLTLGSEAELSGETVAEILTRVKQEVGLAKDIEILREKQARASAEDDRLAIAAKYARVEGRVASVAHEVGRIVRRGVLGACIALAAVGSFAATFGVPQAVLRTVGRAPVASVLFVVLLWGIWNWSSGSTFRSIASRCGDAAEVRVYRIVAKYFAL